MRDDTIMAERVGQLQQENEELKRELKDLKWRHANKQVWHIACGVVVTLAVVFGLFYLIYNGLHSKVTNDCYIESETRQVRVFVIRKTVDWGSDRLLGVSSSIDEALKMAEKQSCQVRVLSTEKGR
jgi:hypothetical protein